VSLPAGDRRATNPSARAPSLSAPTRTAVGAGHRAKPARCRRRQSFPSQLTCRGDAVSPQQVAVLPGRWDSSGGASFQAARRWVLTRRWRGPLAIKRRSGSRQRSPIPDVGPSGPSGSEWASSLPGGAPLGGRRCGWSWGRRGQPRVRCSMVTELHEPAQARPGRVGLVCSCRHVRPVSAGGGSVRRGC
jgi:hypothetical protein